MCRRDGSESVAGVLLISESKNRRSLSERRPHHGRKRTLHSGDPVDEGPGDPAIPATDTHRSLSFSESHKAAVTSSSTQATTAATTSDKAVCATVSTGISHMCATTSPTHADSTAGTGQPPEDHAS